MSFQSIDETLDKAFELIEANRLDEARAILKPVLDTQKDNPDVWWLYAHAVTDPETAKLALSNVQRLDPNYLNTGDLLYALETNTLSDAQTDSDDKEPSFLPPLPSTLPGLPQSGKKTGDEDDWDAFEGDDDESVPLFRRPIFLLVAGLLIFLVIAALVILNPPPQPPPSSDTPAPTEPSVVLQAPTESVTETPTSEPTAEATPISTNETQGNSDEYGALYTALNTFDIPELGISQESTSMGNTLVISVCTEAGAKLRQTLPLVIKALSDQLADIPTGTDGVGIRMIDCSTSNTLLLVGVSSQDIASLADGMLDNETFQAKWVPIT